MHSANFTHILQDNKSPFFFTRNTHDYVPIWHCNHHSIQHNQDALPASNLFLFQCLCCFAGQNRMSSPPHSRVGTFGQLKSIWNSLKAKNKWPSEEVSSLKVRNLKHWEPEWRNTSKLTGETSERTAERKIKLESNQTSGEYGQELPFVSDKQKLCFMASVTNGRMLGCFFL